MKQVKNSQLGYATIYIYITTKKNSDEEEKERNLTSQALFCLIDTCLISDRGSDQLSLVRCLLLYLLHLLTSLKNFIDVCTSIDVSAGCMLYICEWSG